MKTIFEYYNDIAFVVGRIFYPIWLSLGILFFVFHLERRNKFILRLCLMIIGVFTVSILVPMNTPYVPINAIAILISLIIGMYFTFKITWKSSIFFCITSAILQNLSWHISSGLNDILIKREITILETTFPFLSYDVALIFTFSILLSYGLSYFLFIRQALKNDLKIKTWKLVLLAVLILIIVYLISNIFSLDGNNDNVPFRFAMSITCFSLLTSLYTTAAVDKHAIDSQIMDQLFHKEQKHYENLMANQEIMNKRIHDLKYQIRALENNNTSNECITYIKENIKSYESIPKTFNDALDNTINDKVLLCQTKNINFEFHVNGKALSFMNPVDIYILFGNALDNAIEATEKIEKIEERIITMISYQQESILKFHIENPISVPVNISKNSITTSKKDSFFHGYGTKSMKEIVSKYDGSIVFSTKDNKFLVDLIFSINN